MTWNTFFGCALTAYGPPAALFAFTIAKDPVRIIILILSAFFWLLSILFSSILWFAVVPLREELAFGLVFSVTFQELCRLLIYALLHKADRVLRKLTENEHTIIFKNQHVLSYVVGLGFGIMSGAFSLVNVLADSVGPGSVGFDGEQQSFFMISAALCMAMILCHTVWGVITFAALNTRKWHFVGYVWVAHYFVSCMTLLNVSASSATYAATLISSYVVLVMSTAIAFHLAGGSLARLATCLKFKRDTLSVPS